MNTRKIWMLAIVFGLLTSLFVFLLTTNNTDQNQIIEDEFPPYEESDFDDDPSGLPYMDVLGIAPGKRAMSLAVNSVQSVSGFIKPGSYVDVVAVHPLPISENTSANIILEGIRVLAVGGTFLEEENGVIDPYDMVTLEVTPNEGAILAFAKEASVVTLLLRGLEEEESISQEAPPFEDDLVEGQMPE